MLAGLILAGGAYWALWHEPNTLVVEHYEIGLPGWEKSLDGYKIIAISDIHGGSVGVTPEKIRLLVDRANEQDPDLIVLLGDFVSQKSGDREQLKMPIDEIAMLLRPLRARDGVFAVIGNHDNWYGYEKVRGALERAGIAVLEDEAKVIESRGTVFTLIGTKDALKSHIWAVYSKEEKEALARVGARGKIIAITHNPDIIDMITGELLISNDLVLLLAGHTHGGQVWLPILGAPVVPSSYGQKYAKGVIIDKGIKVFVTPGIGTSILPLRFMVPPEISVVSLRAEN